MLNKAICKRCIEEFYYCKWSTEDEICWREGKVPCHCGYQNINDPPPKDCFYKFEQEILGQQTC